VYVLGEIKVFPTTSAKKLFYIIIIKRDKWTFLISNTLLVVINKLNHIFYSTQNYINELIYKNVLNTEERKNYLIKRGQV